jgi:iron-sulfur cluster repair protein YtfE (RIC family)
MGDVPGLVGIGRKRGGEGVVGSVNECHARIRSFAELAVRICDEAAGADEKREAASSVLRYFTVGLPLHVADEEQSIEPRLRRLGRTEVNAALDVMHAQHHEHEALLARVIPQWRAEQPLVQSDAIALQRALEAHLVEEERVILPAINALSDVEQRAILDEQRTRRER